MDTHNSNSDKSSSQANLLKLDDTQLILNAVEHLPLFTAQLLEELPNQISTDKFSRLLVGLHLQLQHLAAKTEATNFERVSNVLTGQRKE